MPDTIGSRLEKYTLINQQEVLMVDLETADGEPNLVMIYAGFSSSLMQPTNFDPDIPIVADGDRITSIDRLVSPYNPARPQYIERGISLAAMLNILNEMNL